LFIDLQKTEDQGNTEDVSNLLHDITKSRVAYFENLKKK